MMWVLLTPPRRASNARFDLGEHAAGDGAAFHQVVDLADGEVADEAGGIIGAGADAVGVGDDDELFGLHLGGDRAGGGVGIDVESAAGLVAGDGGDARDRVRLHQQLQQAGVDVTYVADVSPGRSAGRRAR